MKATVLITHLDDHRIMNTIESALIQGRALDEVLVADGGSKPDFLRDLKEHWASQRAVRFLDVPGSVAESRNLALPHIRSPIVAFLDSDEAAPPQWLERLIAPITAGTADFTGGPTHPLHPKPKTRAEAYVNREDAALYKDGVPRDLALLPMGNSAWRTDLLRRIGGFDPRLGIGGEDYDVNLRALQSGARGAFVPDAWVYHDQSHLDSFRKILKRKSRYYFGAATAYLKNGAMRQRGAAAAKRFRIRHPVDAADLVLKPWAYWKARRYYRRAFGPNR